MGKTTFFLMIITLISKLTGLVREQVFAYYLGTGDVYDAYSTASTIPFILFGSILQAMIAGYIPIYSEIKNEHGENQANKFTSNLLNIITTFSTLFIAIIILISPLLVSIFAPGYIGSKRELSIQFTKIFAFSLYPTMISSVFIGFLQMKNRFIVSETHGIIMNGLHIVTIILSNYFNNYYIVAYGIVITEFLKFILFPKAIMSENYIHIFKMNFKDKYVIKLIKFSIPVLISISVMDLLVISDQSLASIIMPNGGVSALRYSSLIYQIITGIIITSIITTTYPTISDYASKKQYDKMKKTMMDGVSLGYILVIPSMIGVMILAEPLVTVLFQRGSFTAESTKITSGLLFYYMPVVIGFTIKQIFNRGFYAMQNTTLPIITTVVQVVLNIILNYALSAIWGINGLVIASSIASLVSSILAVYLFRKKYGQISFKSFINTFIKLSFASLLMGVVTYYSYSYFSNFNMYIALLISIILSVIFYGVLILFMRIPSVMKTTNKLYHKFIKK